MRLFHKGIVPRSAGDWVGEKKEREDRDGAPNRKGRLIA